MIDQDLQNMLRVEPTTVVPPQLPPIPTTPPLTNNVRTTNSITTPVLSAGNVDVATLLSNYASILQLVTQNIQTITNTVLNADIDS